jgi:hypothetical protein
MKGLLVVAGNAIERASELDESWLDSALRERLGEVLAMRSW